MKEFKIKFIPTGIIFSLPKETIDELLANDRGNYEVLDKDYKDVIPEEIKETTTYEKVVVEEKPKKKKATK